MMTAEARRIYRAVDPMSGERINPVVEVDPENFAHGVWTALAVTLAAPLRKAFDAHLDTHGCGRPGSGGFAYCDEAMSLFRLLPAGDRIIWA